MGRLNPDKIVVFTGAGISAESGIPTFRGKDGLWRGIDPMLAASIDALERDPELVMEFYSERFAGVRNAEPNAAHLAVTELENDFEVIVITQNVDDLHERAGSSNVIHLHGCMTEVRAMGTTEPVHHRGLEPLKIGDVDEHGRQLRPNIVLFGEAMMHGELASEHLSTAGRVLVIGTSLAVYPAAGLLNDAHRDAEKVLIAHEVETLPRGFRFMRGDATDLVPQITAEWRRQ